MHSIRIRKRGRERERERERKSKRRSLYWSCCRASLSRDESRRRIVTIFNRCSRYIRKILLLLDTRESIQENESNVYSVGGNFTGFSQKFIETRHEMCKRSRSYPIHITRSMLLLYLHARARRCIADTRKLRNYIRCATVRQIGHEIRPITTQRMK